MALEKITFEEAKKLFNDGGFVWIETDNPAYREDEDETQPMYHPKSLEYGDVLEDLFKDEQYYYDGEFEG